MVHLKFEMNILFSLIPTTEARVFKNSLCSFLACVFFKNGCIISTLSLQDREENYQSISMNLVSMYLFFAIRFATSSSTQCTNHLWNVQQSSTSTSITNRLLCEKCKTADTQPASTILSASFDGESKKIQSLMQSPHNLKSSTSNTKRSKNVASNHKSSEQEMQSQNKTSIKKIRKRQKASN